MPGSKCSVFSCLQQMLAEVESFSKCPHGELMLRLDLNLSLGHEDKHRTLAKIPNAKNYTNLTGQ